MSSLFNKNINELTIRDFAKSLEKARRENKIETARRALDNAIRALKNANGRELFRNKNDGYALIQQLEEFKTINLQKNTVEHIYENFADGETERMLHYLYHPLNIDRCSVIMGYAIRILPYVFLRSETFRSATWDEINFDDGTWKIIPARLKNKKGHCS